MSRLQDSSASIPPDLVTALLHEGENHLRLQRPLAAWASWQRALRIKPDDPGVSQALEHLASALELPAVARAAFRFQTPDDSARRARWDAILSGRVLDDLDQAAGAFTTLVSDDPTDVHARLNLALCHAWRGRNLDAIRALEDVVDRAADNFERAAQAWTLAELLRFGGGAETVADDLRYAWVFEWAEGHAPPAQLFESWPDLVPVTLPPDPTTGAPRVAAGQRLFEWLDRPLPAQPSARAEDLPRVLAAVVLTPHLLRLSSPDPTGFALLSEPPWERLLRPLQPCRREKTPLPIAWADAALGTFHFPVGRDDDARATLTRDAVEHYYENVWIHLPRLGLDGRTPWEASRGDVVARAKLAGVVDFRAQLGARPTHLAVYQGYPFDRLRRRLGLIAPDDCPGAFEPADLTCAGAAELDQLDPEPLPDARLADAFAAAAGLRDDDRIARFAAVLARRELGSFGALDPRVVIAPLVRVALRDRDPEQALEWLERARALTSGDVARAFAVWTAEVHARTGGPDAALRIYQGLLERPDAPAVVALDGAETLLDNGYAEQALPLLVEARARAVVTGERQVLQKAEALLPKASRTEG